MADKWIEFDVEGERELLVKFDLAVERQRRRSKELLDDLADFATMTIRSNAPDYSGYTHRHVGRTRIQWRPGGAGGGGTHEVVTGIRAGFSRHPIYAEIGTGIYGKRGRLIVPLRAQFMIFFGKRAGRMLAKRTVKGQRAQRYFYKSWQELLIYAKGRIMAADLTD